MKQFYSALIFLFISGLTANAQSNIKLHFNSNGDFKIVQFTDTHVDLTSGANLQVTEIINKVIDIEKPDLVILTGDVVTQDDPQKAFQEIAGIFASANIPWAIVFGNHESEHNLSRKDLSDFLQKLPFCLNKTKNYKIGFSNYVLPVYSSDNKAEALIYCMDSNDYSTLKTRVEGYGWFTFSQIAWYKSQSLKMTKRNNDAPLPALAFFHIPLPEYNNIWDLKDAVVLGVKGEVVCCPDINSGMFTAMLECGDVMGTFTGHDHYNDFIGVHHNIALAYGRVTKIMKNPEDPLAGGRVIVLKESKREFDSWIRDYDGKKVLECSYPSSFMIKKQ